MVRQREPNEDKGYLRGQFGCDSISDILVLCPNLSRDRLRATHAENDARRLVLKLSYMVRAVGGARAFNNCGGYCVPNGLQTLNAGSYK